MTTTITTFAALGLEPALLRAVEDEGYEQPTPIQAATIPPLLEGRDIIGQAQTGTGKTAAFALPLLSRVDPSLNETQVLVLAPTRELAMQVAEAMRTYATHLSELRVLPIYGGTGFEHQFKQLKRGAHVVVGTPGRVMDHMRRGSLNLGSLRALVLDEADEMLRMGFVDDVEWILEQTPAERQTALFSATMPSVIRSIANKHLTNPVTIRIESETRTAETVNQRYRLISHHHKLEVLSRILETEQVDGTLIFVRTRVASAELAERLRGMGHSCEALNGDVAQAQREKTVARLKDGRVDILVATDVAARGLDVDRLTHVINFDVPHDAETYVHRIGRTGRAGRAGEAILFVTPRERHVVKSIERATGQRMEPLLLPTTEEVNAQRVERFKARIVEATENDEIAFHREIVVGLSREHDLGLLDIAAALSMLAQGDEPLLLERPPRWEQEAMRNRDRGPDVRYARDGRSDRAPGGRGGDDPTRGRGPRQQENTEFYRIEAGYQHGVKPANIVGAIAGETGLEGRRIGHIDIKDDHTIVELPAGMPEDLFRALGRATVCGQEMRISRAGGSAQGRTDRPARTPGGDRPARPGKPAARPARPDARKGAASRGPSPRPAKKTHRKGTKKK